MLDWLVQKLTYYVFVFQVQQPVRAKYMTGYDINERMRALLIDWLIQVHSRFQLLPETLYMTVAILDRYLQVRPTATAKGRQHFIPLKTINLKVPDLMEKGNSVW